MFRIVMLLILFSPALPSLGAGVFQIKGSVTKVKDGDTVLMKAEEKEYDIRLSDIDAPEISHGRNRPGQPYSKAAQKMLSALVTGGQPIMAKCYEYDMYERAVCHLFTVDGNNVNSIMVRNGMAWVSNNPRYVREKSIYQLEKMAKLERLGLWAEPNNIPPWEWRKSCWQAAICENSGF